MQKRKIGRFYVNSNSTHSLRRCLLYVNNFINRNKLRMSDLFYRGEAQNYGYSSLESKLYRPIYKHEKCMEYGNTYLYKYVAEEFHREINILDRRKTIDFMAYCQHHGLPTPLLDVTTSLLVGLYFACCNDFKLPGYLYLFNKNRFIQYPSYYLTYKPYFLKPYALNPFYNLQRLEKLLTAYNNTHTADDIAYLEHSVIEDFDKYYDNNILFLETIYNYWEPIDDLHRMRSVIDLKNYLVSEIQRHENYSELDRNGLTYYYIQFLEYYRLIKSYNELRDGLMVEVSPNASNALSDANEIVFYMYMSRIYVNHIQEVHHEGYDLGLTDYFVPSKFIFYVKTNYEWDRVQAQNGDFLIEYPLSEISNPNLLLQKESKISQFSLISNKNKNLVGNINPDYVIKLNNKRHIMKELDNMGINNASLFKDPDNKATYIWKKYTHNI